MNKTVRISNNSVILVSMRSIQRNVNTPAFVPDYMAASVSGIDFEKLKANGIKYIAFDADSTLVHFAKNDLASKTKKILKQKRALFTAWCLASNRPPSRLRRLGKDMDMPVVPASIFTRKPSKRYFNKLIKHFDGQPNEIAMVGDKLLADMFGAKRMGLTTVWVERIGPDSIWDRLLGTRRKETRLIKEYLKHYQ